MNIFVVKIVHKWLKRHKLRYVLSWISFALVSIILVSVYSIGAQLQDDIVNHVTVNPLSYQIRVRNTCLDKTKNSVSHNLNEYIIQDMGKNTNATEIRTFYSSSLRVLSVNGTVASENLGNVMLYTSSTTLLLKQESEYLEYISQTKTDYGFVGRLTDKAEDAVIVTKDFLDRCKMSADEALGSQLVFSDDEDNHFQARIAAVLTAKDTVPAFAMADIYVPYVLSSEQNQYAKPQIELVTFTYEAGTYMEKVSDYFSETGYIYSVPGAEADMMQSIKNSITIIGSIIGVFMLTLASFGLANSVMVTINENLPFISLLRIIGLRKGQYAFIVIYMAAVQGLVGGMLGSIGAYVFQLQIPLLINMLKLNMSYLLGDFSISFSACLLVIVLCVIVSALISFVVLICTRKDATVQNLHGEAR